VEKRKPIFIAVVGLMSGLLTVAPNAADATSTSIDFPNASATDALDVNSAGDIVGRYVSANGNTHGYLRTRRGRFITINFPRAIFTVAAGINSHIVGQYQLSTDPRMARHGFTKQAHFQYDRFSSSRGIHKRTGG